MSHSFVCLTVHLVFHIKSTAPCFRQEDLETVWKYIAGTIHRLGANAYKWVVYPTMFIYFAHSLATFPWHLLLRR